MDTASPCKKKAPDLTIRPNTNNNGQSPEVQQMSGQFIEYKFLYAVEFKGTKRRGT